MTHPEPGPTRFAAPPLFALLELQFAAAVGLLMTAVPYWLSNEKVPLAAIAMVSALGSSPHSWKLLWVPLIDLWGSKRAWYSVCAFGASALIVICAVFPNPSEHLVAYGALLALLQALAATAHSTLNGLMATTTRPEDKGRTGGWQMAGNVGGTSLMAYALLVLANQTTRQVAGLAVAGIAVVSSLAIIWIPERPAHPSLHNAALFKRFKAILSDLWAVAKSTEGWTGLLICLAPIGCGALTNLFSGMAGAYGAGPRVVENVNGIGMGICGAAGSLVGGILADRLNRRFAYALAGATTALCAFAMAAGSLTPLTYTWGILAYSFANGIAFASFAGFVLEMVKDGAGVTTKYTLFVAASNFAINYTTALDGWASTIRDVGVRGSLVFDGAITLAGIAVLGLTALLFRPKASSVPAATA